MNKPNLYLDLDETLIYSIDIRYRKKLPFFIEKFKYYGIKPIFVIDGRPPIEKTTKLKRSREKSTVKLTKLINSDEITTDTNKTESLLKKSLRK